MDGYLDHRASGRYVPRTRCEPRLRAAEPPQGRSHGPPGPQGSAVQVVVSSEGPARPHLPRPSIGTPPSSSMLSSIALALTLAAPGVSLAPSAPLLAPTVSPAGEATTSTAAAPTSKGSAGTSVSIKTPDKLLLQCSYWAPKGKERAPAALLVHEAGADRTSLNELGEYLQKKGFAVLAVDVRGHGGSVQESADWSKATDDKTREALWGLAARDVDAAAEYLLGRSEVLSTNLSVFGVGAGAALAVRHAKADDMTRAVVLITPPAECYGFNMAQGVAQLGGIPTLIVASNKAKDVAEQLKASGHEANEGVQYIEISLVKAEPAAVLGDSKLNNSAVTWLRERVMDDGKKKP
jgi:dienelactone hydrolase